MMRRAVWAAIGVGAVALDAYAAWVRRDGTLSQVVREVYRTDTTAGRVRLVATWAAASAWLLPHLCVWPEDRLVDR